MEPDIKLLRDHGTDGSFGDWKSRQNLEQSQPFCLKFRSGDLQLHYIGAQHTTDPKSDTFTLIRLLIRSVEPKLIVIEGIPFKKGISPTLKNFQGEGQYAIEIGENMPKGAIPFTGIESDESDILINLSKTFDVDDIYGFLFLRMHKYFFKTMGVTEKEFIESFNRYDRPDLDKLFSNSGWDHMEWHKSRFDEPFVFGENLEHSSPYCGDDGVITQKISCQYGKMRDTLNIQTLYKLINEYKDVIYIMGQNHVYADYKVLRKSFGPCLVITLEAESNEAV